MMYNVFDTEQEANEAQSYDYQSWIAVNNNPSYVATTTAWAIPQQRITDNKWVYPVCPTSDATYTTEEYDPIWFGEVVQ